MFWDRASADDRGRRATARAGRAPRTALPALVLLAALFVPGPSHAQGVGKNKVQYERLQWLVLETPHVRLHYYAAEESLARHLAAFA